MCVILSATNVREILKLPLHDIWTSNPDGAGIGYRTVDGKPHCIKGLMNFKALKRALKELPPHVQIVVHCRIATHGAVTKENTHPFQIDDSAMLFHNGTMGFLGEPGDNGFSDSLHLALMLGRLHGDDREILMGLVMEVGKFNKFVVMGKERTLLYGNFQEVPDNRNVKASNLSWTYRSNTTTRYYNTPANNQARKDWNDDWKKEYNWDPETRAWTKKTAKELAELNTISDKEQAELDAIEARVSSIYGTDYDYEDVPVSRSSITTTPPAQLALAPVAVTRKPDFDRASEVAKNVLEAAIGDGEAIDTDDPTASSTNGVVTC